MGHLFSSTLALLLSAASLQGGQATTTTTALEPFNDPTTTESTNVGTSGASDATTTSDAGGSGQPGATRSIMGSFLVSNVDYAALNNDTSLKTQFENQCKNTIAGAAGTLASNVQVTLSSGSVKVDYTIVLPTSSSASARTALTSAINGSLTTDLVEALREIPGIEAVTSGSMSVSRLVSEDVEESFTSEDVEESFTGGASLRTSSLYAAAVLALAAFAAPR